MMLKSTFIQHSTKKKRRDCHQSDFISYVNSFHRLLDFTWEINETFDVHDIWVSITANYRATIVHYEPTDPHSYLL